MRQSTSTLWLNEVLLATRWPDGKLTHLIYLTGGALPECCLVEISRIIVIPSSCATDSATATRLEHRYLEISFTACAGMVSKFGIRWLKLSGTPLNLQSAVPGLSIYKGLEVILCGFADHLEVVNIVATYPERGRGRRPQLCHGACDKI
jgi:hypothetical protein